jgi:membrane protease YdiL (CAAX protease family)
LVSQQFVVEMPAGDAVVHRALLIMTGAALALAMLVQKREFFALHWRPTRDTIVALAVGLLVTALSAFALWLRHSPLAYAIALWILIFGVCGFTLPFAYVFLVERRSWVALGIHPKRLAASVLLGLLFAAPISYATLQQADVLKYPPSRLLGAVFSLNVGGLFELFLYYGFIHLRLKDAFGSAPAILGTAALYSLWHIGTELPMHAKPGEALILLFVVGLLYQSVFAITYNVFIIWPVFFTAGVMHDFIVNLDLPEAVTTGLVWPLIGFACALVVPATLRRCARAGARR